MTWQLRATEGPLAGAVYRLRKGTSLGRAGDCDIQIIHDGVSRRHAKVVVGDEGCEVVDLGSNNGTYVGGKRVHRCQLRIGDEIRIMRTRFVYEGVAEDQDSTENEVWAVKVTDGSTLRQTIDEVIEHIVPSPSQSPPRRDTEEDLEQDTPAEVADGNAKSGRRRVTALRPDGRPYDGNLVGDILTFRDLQLRVTRHETVSPVELDVLQRFSRGFRQPPDDPSPFASLRRFVRFRCRLPARIRWIQGAEQMTATVDIHDLSVGGALVMWRDHPLFEGVVAWLVIDMVHADRPRTVVFPTRVAWALPNEIGLQFAGMPERERVRR